MRLGQRLWLITSILILLFFLNYWIGNSDQKWTDELVLCTSIVSTLLIHFFIERVIISRTKNIVNFASKIVSGDQVSTLNDKHSDEINDLVKVLNSINAFFLRSTKFIEDIGNGNLDAEMHLNGNATNQLSVALVSMRNRMKTISETERERQWVSEGLTKFNDLLRTHNEDLDILSRKVIAELVNYLNVNQGGIFLVEDKFETITLELKASYAYDREKFLEKSIEVGEGLLGQAYLEKSVIQMLSVPKGYIHITSGLGKAVPKSVLIVPILVNEDIYGLLEFASFQVVPSYKVDFLKRFCETLGSTIGNVKNVEKTKRLLEEAQQQGEEMRAQEEEMRQNVEELSATQEEMARKQKELEKVNKKMQGHESVLKKALEKAKAKEKEAKHNLELLKANEQLMSQNLKEMELNQVEMLKNQDQLDLLNQKLKQEDEKLKQLLEKSSEREKELQQKNEALQSQEEELRQNMEELAATQEEMVKKQNELEAMRDRMAMNEKILQKAFEKSKKGKKELQTRNEQLRAQEEELRQNMEEMISIQEETERKQKELEIMHSKVSMNERILQKAIKKAKENELRLKENNEQLQAQEEELRQNMEELSATQEEMAKKQQELEHLNEKNNLSGVILQKALKKSKENELKLKENNEQLQAQEEELRQNMEELYSTQEVLSQQMEIVQSKNQTIIESINYAKVIQQSILPTTNFRKAIFPNNVVFYKPKDIVSGDFYWFYKDENYRITAIVDCTGHGVPGAFMSLVAHSTLVELIKLKEMRDPSEILSALNTRIIEKLSQIDDQEEETSNDGMDLSICVFNDAETTKEGTYKLTFAGAKSNLQIINKGVLIEVKGDRVSVGGRTHLKEKPFTNHDLLVEKGDMIYQYTDGMVDQANTDRKRFSSKKLKQLFLDIHNQTPKQQLNSLEKALKDHQGDAKQRDDITIIGLKV